MTSRREVSRARTAIRLRRAFGTPQFEAERSAKPKATRSSGNVFKDLCLNRPKKALEAAKIIVKLSQLIARRGLSIDQAAAVLELHPTDLPDALGGHTRNFSTERLKALVAEFTERTKIETKKPSSVHSG